MHLDCNRFEFGYIAFAKRCFNKFHIITTKTIKTGNQVTKPPCKMGPNG